MKHAATMIGLLSLTLLLAGCPIWVDTESVEVSGCTTGCCDGGCPNMCTDDADCASGYYCESGFCNATWFCDFDGSCPPGFVCDERETCVPERPVPCDGNEDCVSGYCDIEDGANDGTCVTTGSCSTDEDCTGFGPGLACDDRGICTPDEGPCPAGECGCIEDAECEDGQVCISSRCTDASSICVFNFECGTGVCANNECHATCTDTCPVGQKCEDGICNDFSIGPDGCVYDEDCGGGFACINATCHPTCETADTCGAGETCRAGACRADTSPIRECADSSACTEGTECVRGFCRMPCVAPINCADEAGMSECVDGFCRFPSELAPACSRATDCGQDGFCLDGQCL
jgi:hypothetical protein